MSNNLKKMNVRKMRRIGKDILAEPRRFNMIMWFAAVKSKEQARLRDHSTASLPPCGTTCCFAGEWAIRYRQVDPMEIASDDHDGYTADGKCYIPSECMSDLGMPNSYLLFKSDWPDRLTKKMGKFKAGTKAYANYFVKVVLEDYIKTNGWD